MINPSALTRTIDRIPPNNLEAEMAAIGSILVDREMMSTVSEILTHRDFYSNQHETIYLALAALYERGEPLDKITLAEELKTRGLLDHVGGIVYLSTLMDTVPTAASAEYYAKIVREKSALRGLIKAGTQITKLGYEAEEDVDEALDSAEQIVYEVGKRNDRGQFDRVSDLLLDAFQRLEQRYYQRGNRTGVTSGFRDIDMYTAGFQPGNLIILAARPAMGKTSMALNMAVAAAKEDQKPVAVFSLEMTNQELVERLMCSEARLDAMNLRKGTIAKDDWPKISHAMGVLNDLPMYLDDSGTITITEIRSRCRRLQSMYGLSAVIIDYLQLVRPGNMGKQVNRNEELSDICRTLKATAKDLQIPIIALAQLNRAVETRQDKRPMLSDLRDCLAGEAMVANADTGERVAMADIVARNLRFNVWAVDDRLRIVRKPITNAWAVSKQQTYKVATQSGRSIYCTAGHRFLTVSGWHELRDLTAGRHIAVPRKYENLLSSATMTCDQALLLGWLIGDGHLGGTPTITTSSIDDALLAQRLGQSTFGLRPALKAERMGTPAKRVVFTTGRLSGAGKTPLTSWLRRLGIWKVTGVNKCVPREVFLQPNDVVAAFLRGLFHADGSFTRAAENTRATVRLATISKALSADVRHLLLRFGINAITRGDRRNIGGFRTKTGCLWTVAIQDRASVCTFMDVVGFVGQEHSYALGKVIRSKRSDAGQFDRIPVEANERVRKLRHSQRLSHADLGWRDQGKAMSRSTAVLVAERLHDAELATLGSSDVLWDPIVSIEPDTVAVVYDLTVGDVHNFCVDDIVTHNSGAIEQEADIVAFLYRDDYYNKESADPGITEFILAKQRNGRTGTVKLRFLPEHTLFQSYGDESHFPSP